MTVALRANQAYQDVIEFIASGTTPQSIVAFQPSAVAKARVGELIEREKTTGLSHDEKAELDHFARRLLSSLIVCQSGFVPV